MESGFHGPWDEIVGLRSRSSDGHGQNKSILEILYERVQKHIYGGQSIRFHCQIYVQKQLVRFSNEIKIIKDSPEWSF